MEVSLEQLTAEFQYEIIKTLADTPDIHEALKKAYLIVKRYTCDLIGAWYTQMDEILLRDTSIKRRYKLQHSDRNRSIYTEIGMITYHRSYFRDRRTNKNVYLIDRYNHLEPYQRISDGLKIELVEAALNLSYRKTSKLVTGGNISAQSVMNAIRCTEPVEEEITERRHVPVLHIDVDEDHVSVRKKKKAKSEIARLLVSYEGVDHGSCISPAATGRYGMTSDDFWNESLADMQYRYDLTGTKIYLHADGAKWIAMAKEYFPDVIFVLDKFHKNKALKKIESFLKRTEDYRLGPALREALSNGQKDIADYLVKLVRERYRDTVSKDVKQAMTYLLNNIDGISICSTDPEANNGGCSEPHVSNYLSDRLSSRPRVWGETTLKAIVPLLTARREIRIKKREKAVPVIVNKVVQKQSARYIYDIDPRAIGNVPVLAMGKVNPLYNSLRWLNN